MDVFYDPNLLWLFASSVPIGIFAIVFGGTMFLSIPVFQLLFPEMIMASIIGNIKMGSVIRNVGAVHTLRKHINAKKFLPLIAIFCAGSIIGALLVSHASNALILPTIVVAIFVTEFAPWISKHIPKSFFYLITFAVGIFGGIIGAGILLLIIALLRIAIPEDHNLHHVRSLAIFTELLMAVVAVIVFAFTGHLIFHVWVVWAVGSLIGGFIGGKILHHTGKMSPHVQKWALRAIFVFAVLVSVIRLFYT